MFPDPADSAALEFFRRSVADRAAFDRLLPAGFTEQMREYDEMNRIAADALREHNEALAWAKSVFPDLGSRTDFLPLHRRSETEALSGRIERLEKLLHERIPDPNAPVEPFPHKETGFHATRE